MVTKVKSGVIGDNTVGITQLNVSDGSNGQVLTTNGSGTLSFTTISAGVDGISSSADATAMTITSTENIGIGLTSPVCKLHLQNQDSSNTTILRLENKPSSAATNHVAMEFWGNEGTVSNGVYNMARIRAEFEATTYASTRLTLGSASNNGSFNDELSIKNGRVVVGGGTGSSGDFVVTKNGAEGLEFFAGNSSNVNAIQHYNRSNSNYCENRQIANNHTFYIGGTEKVEIDGSGRLLVGATSAGSQSGPFFVQGASTYACTGQFENTNSGGHYILFSTSGTSRGLIGVGSNSGTGDLAHLGIKSHGGQIQFFANNVKHLTLYENGVLAAGTSTSDLGHNIVNYTTSGYLGLTGDLTGYSAGSYPTLKTNGSYIYFDIGGSYSAYMQSNGTLNANSDRRLKENITTLSSGQLAKVCSLRGVNYTWIDERQTGTQVGVIAQEIQEEYPELVGNGGIEDGTLTVNYAGLVSPLIEAIKELKTELDAAKARITTLEG